MRTILLLLAQSCTKRDLSDLNPPSSSRHQRKLSGSRTMTVAAASKRHKVCAGPIHLPPNCRATTKGADSWGNSGLEKPRTWLIRTVSRGRPEARSICSAKGVRTAGTPGRAMVRPTSVLTRRKAGKIHYRRAGRQRQRLNNRAGHAACLGRIYRPMRPVP